MNARADSPVVTIPLDPTHPLVRMSDEIDWDELTEVVQGIRRKKTKNAAGRRPTLLRATIGSGLLMATRKVSYREAQDLIRYYAPARYLCGLAQSTWTPDHTTIHDFAMLLGDEGMQALNEYVVKLAVKEKLADPSIAAGDTTAQEAAIPYPNEMGLMSSYMLSLGKAAKKARGAVGALLADGARLFEAGKKTLREHRLFAKEAAEKDRLTGKMADIVEAVQKKLGAALELDRKAAEKAGSPTDWGPAGKAVALHAVMTKLLVQIRYWLRTGFVAKDKIISVHIPELYSVVRGKVGKKVEFGLSWGITRLGGGYILATAGTARRELTDSRYVVAAVDQIRALFGRAPVAYAYDRGGDGAGQVSKVRASGVKEIGIAPRGKRPWLVSGNTKDVLVRFRAMIEGSIGALKRSRYDFNRPTARSVRTTAMAGHRAVLGFNLNKLFRERPRRSRLSLNRTREPSRTRRAPATRKGRARRLRR